VRKWFVVIIGAVFVLGLTSLAAAQDNIGGHVGIVVPWVTRAGGETTTQFDSYSIGFPVGVTFKGKAHTNIDMEMVPSISQFPKSVALTVDPGVVWSLPHGTAAGLRVAFDVNSARWGFIPLLNKSWKMKEPKGIFKAYFVEADFPFKFDRPTGGPATNSFTFATHFGLGF
jgi:hypothetical protein